jgi:uncharacterized BrkB/YihY/UPF0761 family membrane protein
LGNTLKRPLFIVAGIAVFAALGFIIGSFVTNWYADYFATSDKDINGSVIAFLLLWPAFACLGGYVGNKLFSRRKLTTTANEPTTAGKD